MLVIKLTTTKKVNAIRYRTTQFLINVILKPQLHTLSKKTPYTYMTPIEKNRCLKKIRKNKKKVTNTHQHITSNTLLYTPSFIKKQQTYSPHSQKCAEGCK